MNEDQIKSQTQEVNNSTENPNRKKYNTSDAPQKPIRTMEKDLAEAMNKANPQSFQNINQNNSPVKPVENAGQENKPSNTFIKVEHGPDLNNDNEIENVIDFDKESGNISYEQALARALSQSGKAIPTKPNPIKESRPEPTKNTQNINTGNAINRNINHPMNILHSQVDPNIMDKMPVIEKAPIRTYENDVNTAIKNKRSSVMNIAIAENVRKGEGSTISNNRVNGMGRKLFTSLAIFVFIIGGIGGLYYLYQISPLANAPIVVKNIIRKSIVTPDKQETVDVKSLYEKDIVAGLADKFNQIGNSGEITEYILKLNNASSSQQNTEITGIQFVNSLNLDITDTLKRSITNKWMLGKYTNENGNVRFMILTTDFFQNAYAGMLKWERNMPEELADALSYRNRLTDMKGSYKDKVINNRDVREYIDKDNQMIILYTFLDKNTLLIATDEAIIPVLIDRIEKQTYIR